MMSIQAVSDVKTVARASLTSDGNARIYLMLLAHRAHGSAYFVVARRGKASLLPPPQHGGRAICRRSQHDVRCRHSACVAQHVHRDGSEREHSFLTRMGTAPIQE